MLRVIPQQIFAINLFAEDVANICYTLIRNKKFHQIKLRSVQSNLHLSLTWISFSSLIPRVLCSLKKVRKKFWKKMIDSEEEDEFLICLFGAGAQFIVSESSRKRRRSRSVWVKDWLRRRNELGCFSTLLRELETESPHLYKNFLRMNIADFNNLLQLVSPLIEKQNTSMREAISAGERLAVTLRYLATGDSFMSLQYLFRINQSTISRIVPEVCDAIYKALLSDYLKVFLRGSSFKTTFTKI